MSDIQQLHKLRKKSEEINVTLIDDLLPFHSAVNPVFRRLPDSNEKGNVTTTCSCLMSMATADKLIDFFKEALHTKSEDDARARITTIFEHAVKTEWTSSGLPDNNAFSSLLVLRTAGLLSKSAEKPLTKPALAMTHNPRPEGGKKSHPVKGGHTNTLEEIAKDFAKGAPDSFGVDGYPSTPAIAYWFVDAIENLEIKLSEKNWKEITRWASRNFARQVSLVTSQHDAMKDPVAMAMAACLATRIRRIIAEQNFAARDEMIRGLPTNIEVEQAVLKAFKFQEESGIWPKYFPLFNYREGGAGSNYFFSFELLEVIVHEFESTRFLESDEVLKGIERALAWCESNRLTYKYKGKTYAGWNSGGQIETLSEGKPESWATAVVHMFLQKLRVALSLLIERRTLVKYGASLPEVVKKDSEDWDKYIDSPLPLPDEETTVKELIERLIIKPIESQENAAQGSQGTEYPHSALLFGPPGTSKTSLVRAVAKRIGWPLVELNPSNFLKEGLENIYSRSDEIFEDLNNLSRTVVFFDEMDALAQKRSEGIDVTRQFLTTSMLPKLSTLHDKGQVLFFMATNHRRNFDEAIKRPGRFDLLICMSPPSWKEKLTKLEKFWPGKKVKEDIDFVRSELKKWVPPKHELVKVLDLFTYGDFKAFLEHIRKRGSLKAAIENMGEEAFGEKVQEWGGNYIALHSQDTKEKPAGEISLREEFEEDKRASRIQWNN